MKYYSTRWRRALLFAQMAGFLHAASSIFELQDLNKHHAGAGEGPTKLNERLLDAATGLNDHDFDDVDIPTNDIYTQEFMMMAYSQLSRDRKTFSESDEGFTYVNLKVERRATERVFAQLFSDEKEKAREKPEWDNKIKAARRKMETKNLDQIGADWVEFDLVLDFYLGLYRRQRVQGLRRLADRVRSKITSCQRKGVSMQDFVRTVENVVPESTTLPQVGFPREMSFARAFIYAMTADCREGPMTLKSFMAAANRMGLDVPFPTVTKRLANYGNPSTVLDDFEKGVAKWNARVNGDPKHDIVADLYGQDQLQLMSSTEEQKGMDFQETQVQSPVKKIAAIFNFNLIQDARVKGDPKLLANDEQE